ncbi:nucleolar protein 10 [Aphidius gifuensis]|uniref:nucleolar protein 10 n=1 Tax=Aphidius gifuensis TaxID=684658 RepID=UPI001CDBFE65|nr:nucleolar protein 10 [Aphidius gifuensis]
MQVSSHNNVKIYNLSAGKSLPEWLSERKRRNLLKKNVDIRRRIELIQDFDMPGISSTIKTSKDGHYVLASGIYKPRIKCFDVDNLSLKFERCFDSEIVTFDILSDDYSKIVFLHCDRHIEFHAAHGKYHRLRIPRFGRDLAYHNPTCDLFIVGVGNDIYRINLERGQFLKSFESEASSINKCQINPVHNLLAVGTQEGKIEAWDPRIKDKVGILDCGFHCLQDLNINTVPSITSLKFQGALTMAVGTITGHILLYDIRSNKPYLIQDHNNNFPIRNIEFHNQMDLVYSMDKSAVKIWDKQNGKIFTTIQSEVDFNDLCIVPDTGMLFMANEAPKMQTYYIPSLGPAPSWSSFLDNLTEELEEINHDNTYDDYKFITDKELEELGLENLKGTNLLRSHLHGHFIDARLYKKTKNIIKPFAFDEYKKKKIKEKIQEDCANRVQVEKLPDVNKNLAAKLMNIDPSNKKNKKLDAASELLKDDRFGGLWTNKDFQIDENTPEFALLNPVISQLSKTKAKTVKRVSKIPSALEDDDDDHKEGDSDEGLIYDDESSSDDEKPWSKEVSKRYKEANRKVKQAEYEKEKEEEERIKAESQGDDDKTKQRPRILETKEGTEFQRGKVFMRKRNNATLGDRVQSEEANTVRTYGSRGNREMSFTTGKRKLDKNPNSLDRRRELKGFLRPANNIGKRKYK